MGRNSGAVMSSRASSPAALMNSSAMWNAATDRASPCVAVIPGRTGKTARPRRRRSSRHFALRNWPLVPPRSWRSGTIESNRTTRMRSRSGATAPPIGRRCGATCAGRGRLVFNASTWERSEVARIPGGAGKSFTHEGREFPSVDLEDGDALVLFREVPPVGYLAMTEADREARTATGDGDALEATAGGFSVRIDPASGAIRSFSGPDGKERVKPSGWAGLNQLVYARGGEHSALWTSGDRNDLKNPPQLSIAQAKLVKCRRERLPGIGVRLVVDRSLEGFPSITSTVTLYDELPWIDIQNRIVKLPTLSKEALYLAFPFSFTNPTVELEVPLGRMTVDRDQQPGSCRDWYCHTHWVWLREGADR